MLIDFVKMHGCGNDFVVIDDRLAALELTQGQVAMLCDRHFGIGADGVILVRPALDAQAAAYMHYINSDGSLAGMCGNGVRCVAKFLVDHGMLPHDASSLVVETLSGLKPISFTVDGQGLMLTATVDMGEPLLSPPLIPTTLPATAGGPFEAVIDAEVETTLGAMRLTCVNMGNPHAVAFLEDSLASVFGLADSDFAALGQPLETHAAFPENCNIEFARLLNGADEADGADIEMRVWERGCGETLACGTGACATAVAAALSGRRGRRSRVRQRGGLLDIAREEDGGHVMMTGPATTVFSGQVEL
jgi:diaminopimelate epimerase